ncbi:MAG: hypothetical protein KA267_04775 [Gemmatimonadales bacterium]|nr:hypothetical protein [Gemmatimonadales bacterium]
MGISKAVRWVVVFGALLAPLAAGAQAPRLSIITQASYAADMEAFGVGAGLGFPIQESKVGDGIRGQATFDWFFLEKVVSGPLATRPTYWEFNVNGTYELPKTHGIYVGTGLNYTNYTVDGALYTNAGGTELGLNAIAGLKLGRGRGAPFAQARYELGGGKQLVLTGGIEF